MKLGRDGRHRVNHCLLCMRFHNFPMDILVLDNVPCFSLLGDLLREGRHRAAEPGNFECLFRNITMQKIVQMKLKVGKNLIRTNRSVLLTYSGCLNNYPCLCCCIK